MRDDEIGVREHLEYAVVVDPLPGNGIVRDSGQEGDPLWKLPPGILQPFFGLGPGDDPVNAVIAFALDHHLHQRELDDRVILGIEARGLDIDEHERSSSASCGFVTLFRPWLFEPAQHLEAIIAVQNGGEVRIGIGIHEVQTFRSLVQARPAERVARPNLFSPPPSVSPSLADPWVQTFLTPFDFLAWVL